jgi:hypothetical protein
VSVAAAALVATAGARSRDDVLPTLYVDYALNCTFGITDDSGKRVTSIAPGTYQILVRSVVVFALVDLSGIDDFTACKGFAQFQLTGPGVNAYTTLQDGDEDKDELKETFQPNATYTAVDLNRPTVARLAFTTSGANTTPDTPPSPYVPSASAGKPTVSVDPVGSAVKSLPTRGTLTATINAAGKLVLRYNGKPLGTLREGRYKTTVTDGSATAGLFFNLLNKNGVPVSTLTASGVTFTGTRTATLTLKKGQWDFVTGGGKKSFFIVVGS